MSCRGQHTNRLTRAAPRSVKGSASELPVSLLILFFGLFFPLLDLTYLAAGCASILLTAERTVARAAAQPNFTTALTGLLNEAKQLNASGFHTFLHLSPVGGYESCGTDLYIQSTGYSGNAGSATYGPNSSVPPPVDTSTHIYEFVSRSTYDVAPLISLSFIPVLGDVPGLGRSARFTMTAQRAVEHPEGLPTATKVVLSGGTSNFDLAKVHGLDAPGLLTDSIDSGWDKPNIYQMIEQAGQIVIKEDVLTVRADNPYYTSTSLDVPPGCRVWIDYRADGKWRPNATGSLKTADGDSGYLQSNGFPTACMIGQIGNGAPFFLGNQQWNLPAPNTGTLMMGFNDSIGPSVPGTSLPNKVQADYAGNEGVMTVRVIIAK